MKTAESSNTFENRPNKAEAMADKENCLPALSLKEGRILKIGSETYQEMDVTDESGKKLENLLLKPRLTAHLPALLI